MDHFNNRGDLSGAGAQTMMEAQDNLSSSRHGGIVDLRGSQTADEVDFRGQQIADMAHSSSWAAAHGPNAPRAP